MARWWVIACLIGLVLTAACDYGSPGIESSPTVVVGEHPVQLTDFTLRLHVARTRGSVDRPLVLFATGDGGWRDVDRAIVQAMVDLGHPVAGFSATDYLAHLDDLGPKATPAHVGTDYATLVGASEQAMGLPETGSVILSGFSRGAALSVIAAGARRLRPRLQGVLVMGLGDVEEHVHPPSGRAPTSVDGEMVKPYEFLRALGSLPLTVIQSSRDRFLAGADARRLFGPDTAWRQLHVIAAGSHTFGGNRAELVRVLARSLSWIGGSMHHSTVVE